jgi:hypothetical protein
MWRAGRAIVIVTIMIVATCPKAAAGAVAAVLVT